MNSAQQTLDLEADARRAVHGTCPSAGSACGLCKSTSLTDLGHGHGNGTVICNACGAKWWKRWYTRKEWDAWINEPNECVVRNL